ncbi:hypothetical protein Q5752_006401 [Cryptotrichosporon argae]
MIVCPAAGASGERQASVDDDEHDERKPSVDRDGRAGDARPGEWKRDERHGSVGHEERQGAVKRDERHGSVPCNGRHGSVMRNERQGSIKRDERERQGLVKRDERPGSVQRTERQGSVKRQASVDRDESDGSSVSVKRQASVKRQVSDEEDEHDERAASIKRQTSIEQDERDRDAHSANQASVKQDERDARQASVEYDDDRSRLTRQASAEPNGHSSRPAPALVPPNGHSSRPPSVEPDGRSSRPTSVERDGDDADAASDAGAAGRGLHTPLFVCTLSFPRMPTILHVFEPRYRLMLQRCIASGAPRFGMVLPGRGDAAPHLGGGISEYGTMLEIRRVQTMPDGRSMVETIGVGRFRVLEAGQCDGYTVGRTEPINDISPEEEIALERHDVEARARRREVRREERREARRRREAALGSPAAACPVPTTPAAPAAEEPAPAPTPAPASASVPASPSRAVVLAPALAPAPVPVPASAPAPAPAPALTDAEPDEPETVAELMSICHEFVAQIRSGTAPWLQQRLVSTYGAVPDDADQFSYWMALVMPIDEYEKARLLPIRSARLRLKLVVHWVEALRSSWWFLSGCVAG